MLPTELPAGSPTLSRYPLSTVISLTLAMAAAPLAVHAGEPAQLPRIAVQADEEAAQEAIKVDQSSSPKFTQPLVDTPQTISIISQEVLRQQGATTLSQALRNTPGVTFLMGENGNTSTGDSIFMRGFDTQGSIFVDGIRDLGTITRDTFNTEQVEIAKGPSGPDNGRTASSGYVNLVTKLPQTGDFADGTISYGTSESTRVTGDINHAFSESTAVRLNVAGQEGGVDGRDIVEKNSWSVAPSLGLGLGSDTRAYFYLLHTRQDNIPDGGVPTIGLEGYYNPAFAAGGANAGVAPAAADTENYYGADSDFEDVEATMFTARFEHDFSPNVTLRNASRYGKTEQEYVLTGVNAGGTSLVATSPNPSLWTASRSRQTKHQENTLLTNQTNLTATLETGSVTHSLTTGLEFIREKQSAPTLGGAGTMPAANVYNPNRFDTITGYALAPTGAFSEGETTTIGLYLFDTIELNDRWQLSAGLRADDYDTDFRSLSFVTSTTTAANNPLGLPVGAPLPVNAHAADTLFSYKVGALFKPTTNSSVYLAYATSQQPPGGSNFTLSGNTLADGSPNANINNPNLDPQKGTNIELGTKWDLMDGALAVTGAIYRSENENDLAQVDPTNPTVVQQFGKKRVDGIELGIVGQLTDAWQITAGLAKMDTEITEGNSTGNSNITGSAINWSPELTFTSWTTYQFPFGLGIGGGVRYTDTVFRSTNGALSPATNPLISAPDYWVLDAVVSYTFNEKYTVQLNGYNLADEEYVASLNNGGSRYVPGTPRSALLTLNARF